MRNRWRFLITGATVALIASPGAMAQDDVKNFKKPILVAETEGHHAPIRSLIWNHSFSLLSGGLDKVVKVWDFGDGIRLSRTIRPMIWRGTRGMIYSMAMTPKPDDRGDSFLAVAGSGILSHGGEITVYRYPGKNGAETGEPMARLFGPGANDPGHRNYVISLAFDPTGKLLASGSADHTAIIWERAGESFRHRATLRGHTGEIHALAFTPDGKRLITTGWRNRQDQRADGTVRAWDVATGAQVDLFDGPIANSGINSLAIHPGGESLVVGRENGSLVQLDPRNLAQVAPMALPVVAQQGPVEHVSFSPDGTKLAVSLISNRANMVDPKTLSCDVEVRNFPGGAVAFRHAGIPGLVYVTAFSPEGGRFAYAGGHSQSIFIRNLQNLENPPTELKGQGTTIISVGFTADSQTVGFTRESNPQAEAAAGPIDGFDLRNRAYRPVRREDVQGPILQHNGWSLRSSLNPYRLEAVNVDGRSWAVRLNPAREVNWWSYTIIPGNPNAERGHPRGVVAVGTETGIVLFDLETGLRTRFLVGHSAPVTALAPSPDGRWLASGSVDQTIRGYSLAGGDTLPGFGATFRRDPNNAWIVDKVDPRGFASSMGLLIGDQLLKAQVIDQSSIKLYQKPDEFAEFTGRLDAVLPNDEIGIFVRRNIWIPGVGYLELDLPPFASSKRNNPALNLLVGLDKEWILWTPRGFYDTSIDGDSRLLGWQINPPFNPTTNEVTPRPTVFLPIASFASKLMRGDILDRIWRNAGLEIDRGVAVRPPPPVVQAPNVPPPPAPVLDPIPDKVVLDEQPPRIEFASLVPGSPLPAPGEIWTVKSPNPRLKVQITGVDGSKVKDRQVVIDDRVVSAKLTSPTPALGEEFAVAMTPNQPVRISVKATNATDNPHSAWIDILYTPPKPTPPPPPPARTPRLIMIGVGIDEFQNPNLPKLEFATNDTQRLVEFLPQHLIPASGSFDVQGTKRPPLTLMGSGASAKEIGELLNQLRQQLRKDEIAKGDMVAIFLESHVLEWGTSKEKTTVVAPADIGQGLPPTSPSLLTRDISERLGELADAGCRVVLFLDGDHLPRSERNELKSSIKPWVRDLINERGVIAFVASKDGPSQTAPGRRERLGLFTQGVLNAFEAVQSGATPTKPLSIKAFGAAVVQQVRNLSDRSQEVGVYVPTKVPLSTPIVHP